MANLFNIVSISILATLLTSTNVLAAPQPEITGLPKDEPEAKEEIKPLDENLSVAEPPVVERVPPPRPLRYYPYHQQLTFRGGRASDFPKLEFDDSVLGFQYLFPKFLAPKLEAGADLHQDGRGHLHVGVRWIYFQRSYFRPSVKLAFDHLADSEEGLATLTRSENYFLRGSGTVELVVWNPFSLRLEAEMLINFDDTMLVLTAGLSRGW